MNKSLRMLNNGTNALDVILESSKKRRSMKEIGFDYNSTNQEGQSSNRKLVVSEDKSEFLRKIDYQKLSKKPQHLARHISIKNHTWRCNFCGRYGHLSPFCYKLCGYPSVKFQGRKENTQPSKEWRPKETSRCMVSHTSLKYASKED